MHVLIGRKKNKTQKSSICTHTLTLKSLARIAPWPQNWLGSGLSSHRCQLLPFQAKSSSARFLPKKVKVLPTSHHIYIFHISELKVSESRIQIIYAPLKAKPRPVANRNFGQTNLHTQFMKIAKRYLHDP